MKKAISKDSGLIILTRPLIVPEVVVKKRARFAGFYRLQTRKAKDLSLVDDTGFFPNLITDYGLNRIGTNGYGNLCHVGAGSATPTEADTSIQTPIYASNNIISTTTAVRNTAPYYGQTQKTWRFGAGTATGTVAEVGVGHGALSSSTMWSRALILDGEGDPTTISIASDEVLDVSYILRVYPPLTDLDDDVTISGDVHTTKTRTANITGVYWSGQSLPDLGVASSPGMTPYSGAIGATTGVPSGTTATGTTGSWSAYSNNSLEREYTGVFGLDAGNVSGGIQSIVTDFPYTLGSFQTEFNPKIAKVNTKVLTLVGKISWDRHVS